MIKAVLAQYLLINHWLPKLFVGVPIYFYELALLIVLPLFLLKSTKIKIASHELTYLCFISYSLFSGTFASAIYGVYSINFFAYSIKYVLFILLAIMIRKMYQEGVLKTKLVYWVINSHMLHVAFWGAYVLWNILFHPVPLSEIVWGYSREYRVIGFTGQYITTKGLEYIGTTSVQFGVYIAFLAMLALGQFSVSKKKVSLLMFLLMSFVLPLSQSRSGIVAYFMGIVTFFFIHPSIKKTVAFLLTGICLTSALIHYWDVISQFGVFSKFSFTASQGLQADSSASTRLTLWIKAAQYIANKPLQILWGTGSAGHITYHLTGWHHLESYFITTLFQGGVIQGGLCLLFFVQIYKKAIHSYRLKSNFCGISLGYAVFIPGYFFANVLGGNSFQTDFIAPLFFGLSALVSEQKKV